MSQDCDDRPIPGEPPVSERRVEEPVPSEATDASAGRRRVEGLKVIVITTRDNVATALEPLSPGQTVDIDGRRIEVREAIASGHKIALTPIASGDPVVKYGSPIGTATADIEAGAHVHIHNVASARGRGDLQPVNEIGPPL